MILHILNTSPFAHDALQRCKDVAAAHDGILLTGDAVLALSNPSCFLQDLPTTQLFALEADCLSRGIGLPEGYGITPVDYDGFVALSVRFDKTISWF